MFQQYITVNILKTTSTIAVYSGSGPIETDNEPELPLVSLVENTSAVPVMQTMIKMLVS